VGRRRSTTVQSRPRHDRSLFCERAGISQTRREQYQYLPTPASSQILVAVGGGSRNTGLRPCEPSARHSCREDEQHADQQPLDPIRVGSLVADHQREQDRMLDCRAVEARQLAAATRTMRVPRLRPRKTISGRVKAGRESARLRRRTHQSVTRTRAGRGRAPGCFGMFARLPARKTKEAWIAPARSASSRDREFRQVGKCRSNCDMPFTVQGSDEPTAGACHRSFVCALLADGANMPKHLGSTSACSCSGTADAFAGAVVQATFASRLTLR